MKKVVAQTIIDILKKIWVDMLKRAFGQSMSYINFNRNVEDLKSKMEELGLREENVMSELNKEEGHPGKKRKREVEEWLREVKKSKEYVRSREDDFKNRSWISFSRYRSARRVEEAIKNIDKLQEQGKFADGLLIYLPVLPTSELVGKTQDIEAIWECLKDEKIGKIGVYGMGGIGKTTIMKHIHNHLLSDDGFLTIWVTVSKPLNLGKLQKDIAETIKLGLSDEEAEEKRSAKLSVALIQRKFVLILDDLWEAFPLEKVGIPKPTEVNGCKIVLTTRDRAFCRQMETQEDIGIKLLSEDYAWELFKEKAGGDDVFSSDLQEVAELVLHECGRLPLGIITVGRALRKKNDIREWEAALIELREANYEIKGMETEVHKTLKFSYDRLRNDTIRTCFLYCALYPDDFGISTEVLIDNWMGEGLIEEKGDRATAIRKGHSMLKELIDSCMLESRPDNDSFVKMHDSLRDMAICITRSNPHFVVKAGTGLEDPLKEDEWVEDVERISLMWNEMERLSGQPYCPKLSTLLLQWNRPLRSIPNFFFHHMKGLRVLDLSYTSIESLPDSVGELENLRILRLGGCMELRKVPSLRKLEALRHLDLRDTKIEELPDGMDEMISLRFLCLGLPKLKRIFRISLNWSSLEKIVVRCCDSVEEFISGEYQDESKIVLPKLKELELFGLPNLKRICRRSLNWSSLEKIYVRGCGCLEEMISGEDQDESKVVLPKLKELELYELPKLKRICRQSLNCSSLEKIYVQGCGCLEEMISGDDQDESKIVLPKLKELILLKLPKLKRICRQLLNCSLLEKIVVRSCHSLEEIVSGEDQDESKVVLPKLKVLELAHLPELKRICRQSLNCSSIEKICVRSCDSLEEIVFGEDQDESKIVFPKLKVLELSQLTELKRFCRQSFNCSLLEKIEVLECPQLRKLLICPPYSPTFALDGVIKGSAEWWVELECDGNTKTLLQPLFKEEVFRGRKWY